MTRPLVNANVDMADDRSTSMQRNALIEKVLRDYVFADCRLGSHPSVHARVLWRRVDDVYIGESSLLSERPNISVDLNSTGIVGSAFRKPHAAFVWEPPPQDSPQGAVDGDVQLLSADGGKLGSMLGVPLFDGREVVGVLSFDSPLVGFFSDRHLQSATLLGVLVVYLRDGPERISPLAARSLGEALRQIRRERGLTQDEVAAKIGTSRIAVSRAESGAQPPAPGLLHAWCVALGVLASTSAARVELIDITPQLLEA